MSKHGSKRCEHIFVQLCVGAGTYQNDKVQSNIQVKEEIEEGCGFITWQILM